ncbi:MAG: helix-turn-helix transcriptional regulator [Lachnospiraceae bacterium]|nr:helix-turn-helix transcriptional regulator [Lachnospiraceae bacterium]
MEADSFGERMKEYRKAHYMTQKQLADMIGVSTNHIGTLEKGKKKPRASTIAAFEDAIQKNDWVGSAQGKLKLIEADRMAIYAQIWKGLKHLEPDKEREVLETFFRIIDWL